METGPTNKMTATISLRLLPSERVRLKELARTEDRTLSHTIRRLLRQLWNSDDQSLSRDGVGRNVLG